MLLHLCYFKQILEIKNIGNTFLMKHELSFLTNSRIRVGLNL